MKLQLPTLLVLALFALVSMLFGGAYTPLTPLLPALMAALVMVAWWCSFGQRSTASWLNWGLLVPAGACMVLALVQALPILGLTHPLYSLIDPTLWPAISLNTPATLAAVVYSSALMLLAYTLFQAARQPGYSPSVLAKGAALVMLAVILYGYIAYANGNTHILWVKKFVYHNAFTATFVSRNHFATFAGLATVTCLALFLERVGEISSRLPHRQRLRAFMNLVLRPGWPWLLASVVAAGAVMLSTSRAGLAATGAGVVTLLVSLALARAAVRPYLLALTAMVVLGGLGLFSITGHNISERLTHLNADTLARTTIYKLTAATVADYPVLGQGYGAFENAFNPLRSTQEGLNISGRVDHAHNLYLEVATELGLPGALALAVGLITLLAGLVHGLKTRRRSIIWPALGLSATVLVGVHALLDFSLSIPAVALAWLMLAANGLALSWPEDGLRRTAITSTSRSVVSVLALGAGAVSLFFAVATWKAFPADTTLHQLATPGVKLAEVRSQLPAARAALQSSLALNPYQPSVLANLAKVEMALSYTNPALAPVFESAARLHLEEAVSLSPSEPAYWSRLAELNYSLNDPQAATAAMVNSLLTGTFEFHQMVRRLPLMYTLYPSLSEDDQHLFASTISGFWKNWPSDAFAAAHRTPAHQEVLRSILAKSPLENNAEWQRRSGAPLVPEIAASPTTVN